MIGLEGGDSLLSPSAFTATTLKWYSRPFVSPVSETLTWGAAREGGERRGGGRSSCD
jgi:hypothetical protein